jgi:hypothetical protein
VGLWSPIHLLSISGLITVPLGVWRAHQHRVADHRLITTLIFSGALVIAGLFTLLPGRIMHAVVFGPRRGRRAGLLGPVPAGLFAGPKTASARRVSLWKNEGKNRSRRSGKGGFEGPDALYDSQPKLTGFSLV